jgi:phosphoribosylamine--glycine ligase/phosphoribosylaminoimidazole synthetase
MNNILIVGNGGREHAIAKALGRRDELNLYYYGTHSNPGLDFLCKHFIVHNTSSSSDFSDLNHAISLYNIEMAIIGPEAYLAGGIVDFLESKGCVCIGPTKDLTQLESSKIFTRVNMKNQWNLAQYNPHFNVLDPQTDTTRWGGEREKRILSLLDFYQAEYGGYVIKEDGLCGGKGVKVSGDHFVNTGEALEYCSKLFHEGKKFLVEEKLIGKEFSLMSFSDGRCIKSMPVVRDFKRAFEGDKGPNTGGMGSISYNDFMFDFLTASDIGQAHQINDVVIKGIQEMYSKSYIGIIYGSFMKLETGEIKVIEYNCRFGDPECINVLSLLKTSLFGIFSAMTYGNLNDYAIEYTREFTVCRYLVPEGYPTSPVKNVEAFVTVKGRGVSKENIFNNNIIFASVSPLSFSLFSESIELKMNLNGSRALAVVGKGESFSEAVKEVEATISLISGPLFSRKDIGVFSDSGDGCGGGGGHEDGAEKFSYVKSGVDIDKGNKVVDKIQTYIHATHNECCFDNYGDFGGMFRLGGGQGGGGIRGSVLVSSTDGVGTKSILAEDIMGDEGLYNLGKDLVNHCVNDILVKGARPLFFLDYFASSKLCPNQVELFVKGASEACKDVGCVLIGGETAEMPGVYREGRVDLVGTIVGEVAEDKIIDGKRDVKKGDIMIGLRSSGPHTNGYSFIRSLREAGKIDDAFCQNMGLLNPHRCYYHDIKKVQNANIDIHALCHVTGGGLIENPLRVLPKDRKFRWKHFDIGETFKQIQKRSGINNFEMWRIFNCGIGMIIFVDESEKEKLLSLFSDAENYAVEIGRIV